MDLCHLAKRAIRRERWKSRHRRPNRGPQRQRHSQSAQYALGANPLAAPSVVTLPTVTQAISSADGQPHLTMTATLDATASGTTIFGQVSSDLQTWSSGANYVQIVSDSTTGSVRTLTLRDRTPVAGAAQRFIRLVVTQP